VKEPSAPGRGSSGEVRLSRDGHQFQRPIRIMERGDEAEPGKIFVREAVGSGEMPVDLRQQGSTAGTQRASSTRSRVWTLPAIG
jgi:hypothetical protein